MIGDHRLGRIIHHLLRASGLAALLAVAASSAYGAGKLPVTWDNRAAGTPIDVDTMQLAFSGDFNTKALTGPKLFAPVHSSFGAGTFDPPTGPAYSVADGKLTIRAYKQDGKWHSGSVQTADADQSRGRAPFGTQGFACKNCYFEARLQFPAGLHPGAWASFWLLSPDGPTGHVEVDALEWYGGSSDGHHATVHIWPPDHKGHVGQSGFNRIPALADGQWHTYGARVSDGTVYIYMDRREVSRVAVPADFDAAYYAVVTLAVLPKEEPQATEPMAIRADYIRAYRPK